MRLIDADKLNRKDVNCANVPMNFIDTAPTVKAIPLDRVEQIKQEVKEWYWSHDVQKLADDPCVVDAMTSMFIRMLDKAIKEQNE